MKTLIKLGIATTILGMFIWIFCILYIDSIPIQSIAVIAFGILLGSVRGVHDFVTEVKLLMPLCSILALGYLAFAVLGVNPYQSGSQSISTFQYWIHYGATRILLLISTIFIIRLLMGFFAIQDILDLPINMRYKKVFILGNILYHIATTQSNDIVQSIDAIPTNQNQQRGLNKMVMQKLNYILALLFMVFRDSKVRGELIDNRIKHCFHGGK